MEEGMNKLILFGVNWLKVTVPFGIGLLATLPGTLMLDGWSIASVTTWAAFVVCVTGFTLSAVMLLIAYLEAYLDS